MNPHAPPEDFVAFAAANSEPRFTEWLRAAIEFVTKLARGMPPSGACEWSVRAAAIAVIRRSTLRAFPDAGAVAARRDV